MRHKLTCLIPCKDERMNIRPCIESFQEIADEVLIADSGSTDGTLDIVRDVGGCRIIEREYRDSGDFKNWAIPQAEHEWILLVDADERATPEMCAEIRNVLAGEPAYDGYWIRRDNHLMGHRIRYSGFQNDSVVRLFRRDLGRYTGPSDHGEVEISTGKVGTLKTRFLHYTCWDYDLYFTKFDRYTTLQAKQWHEAGRRPSYFGLLFRGPFRFFRAYVLQRGFLDGMVGVQLSMLAGFYSFMKQARLWELAAAHARPDPELERQNAGQTKSKKSAA